MNIQTFFNSSKIDQEINDAIQNLTKEEIIKNALISSGAGMACLLVGSVILWKIRKKKSQNLSYLAWGLIAIGGIVMATNIPKFF